MPAWFWAFFPVFLVGMFGFVSWVLSAFGGWGRLAEAYPDDVPVEGITYRWQSAQFGSANYGNCLTITADPSRLRLSILFLFRVGHPPISIPWGDVRVEVGSRGFERSAPSDSRGSRTWRCASTAAWSTGSPRPAADSSASNRPVADAARPQ